jgi:RNA polymerase sigma-70 factor (ECF subfamily)
MPSYLDPADPHAEDPYTSIELRPSVEVALATLTADFRAVVILSDLEGMSLPEVAEALEIPMGTVKSRLFRARRQLASVLGNLSDGSGHPNGTEP